MGGGRGRGIGGKTGLSELTLLVEDSTISTGRGVGVKTGLSELTLLVEDSMISTGQGVGGQD